jgi:hypothetical protein
MECGFIAEDESFYEIIVLHFQLHLLAKVTVSREKVHSPLKER